MNPALKVALLALFLLVPATGVLAQPSDAVDLAGEWSAIKSSLKAGDVDDAVARYGAAFHAAIAAQDAELDARIVAALESARSGPGTIEHALASQVVDKGILHGAYLNVEAALADGDVTAAEPWFNLLRAKFGAALDEAELVFEDMESSGVGSRAETLRPLVLNVFVGKVREELEEVVTFWDDETTRQVKAMEGLAYYGPLRNDVARKLGAAEEAALYHELEEVLELTQSGDLEGVKHAADEARDLLALYGGSLTVDNEGLASFLSALDLVVNEYDAYVDNGQVRDQSGYEEEIKGLFLPTLMSRWRAVEAEVAATHAHEAEEINEALVALQAAILNLAPNAEVRALADTIRLESAEAGAQVVPTGAFDVAAADFRTRVNEAVAAYDAGDTAGAVRILQSAYIDIYGPRLEPRVIAASSALNRDIEDLLNTQLKSAFTRGASIEEVTAIVSAIDGKMAQAQAKVAQPKSGVKLFLDSFFILVREGFEAMLVIGALATYALRTGHKDKARLIYWGAGAGIVASFGLFFIVRALYDTLPFNREILEGVTALLAVVVLFYVSYWLISKVEVGKWNRFIQGKMRSALAKGSVLSLVGVSFLAVFREGFETVLFYQGLYAGASGQSFPVSAGVAVASVVLIAAALAFYRFGVKLPLRPFFIVTSALLYYLAFSFMGTGIHELQEGGVVSTTLVGPVASAFAAVPVLDTIAGLFGIYPTAETLIGQGLLLVAVIQGLAYTLVLEPRRSRMVSDVDTV